MNTNGKANFFLNQNSLLCFKVKQRIFFFCSFLVKNYLGAYIFQTLLLQDFNNVLYTIKIIRMYRHGFVSRRISTGFRKCRKLN